MQRLFSMFPRAAPGVALVLLRAAVAASLWTAHPFALASIPHVWQVVATVSVTGALLVGVMTPVAAGFCALVDLAEWVSLPAAIAPSLNGAATAAALTLLGPGAYSVDAVLFGRRVFVVAPGRPRESG